MVVYMAKSPKMTQSLKNEFELKDSEIIVASQTKKEIENDPIFKDDIIDYDGHGNWGRFPPIKKEKKGKINI